MSLVIFKFQLQMLCFIHDCPQLFSNPGIVFMQDAVVEVEVEVGQQKNN